MPCPGPSEEILYPRSVPREAPFKLGDGKAHPRRNTGALQRSHYPCQRKVEMSGRTTEYVRHSFLIGKHRRDIDGGLVVADGGNSLQNYSDERSTQAVRELAYKILSEAVSKLEAPGH